MTRAYFYNQDIKQIDKNYDYIKDKLDAKELKRQRKKRKNKHSKRRKDDR